MSTVEPLPSHPYPHPHPYPQKEGEGHHFNHHLEASASLMEETPSVDRFLFFLFTYLIT
jgi:hypothetical protein